MKAIGYFQFIKENSFEMLKRHKSRFVYSRELVRGAVLLTGDRIRDDASIQYPFYTTIAVLLYRLIMRAFGILPMVLFEILPMVPLVANGTICNQRTLNVSR